MQLLDHEVQAVHDQLLGDHVVAADLVAHAGVVPVLLALIGERVPSVVVEAPVAVEARDLFGVEVDLVGVVVAGEVQPLAPQPALAGVVVDHVDDDLDVVLVQLIDHLLELVEDAVDLARGVVLGAERELWAEEAHVVVAPVAAVQGFLVHRHQLDAGDAQVLEVGGHLADATPGAGVLHSAGGVRTDALGLDLVEDEVGPVVAVQAAVLAGSAPVGLCIRPLVDVDHRGDVFRRRVLGVVVLGDHRLGTGGVGQLVA